MAQVSDKPPTNLVEEVIKTEKAIAKLEGRRELLIELINTLTKNNGKEEKKASK